MGSVESKMPIGVTNEEVLEDDNLANGLHCGSSLSQIDEQAENRSDDLPFVENGVEEE